MRKRATRCLLPECNRPLSLLRRFRGYEFCCPGHFIEFRRQNLFWEPPRPPQKDSFFERHPWGRRAFLGALGVAAIGYVSTQLPPATFRRPAPPPPKPKPSEHNATFDFSRAADLASWQPLDLAPRHEPGRGLSLAGPLLYSALPRVSAGSLDLSLYLESGSADLLLGYDRQTRDHSCVRLIVEPGAVRLLALDIRDENEVARAQPLILSRDGHSRHDLSIRFDSRSILARWGDAQTYWENLDLRPGYVGISASAADQALLLAARLALRA
jgi:hypothetical protein